MKRIAVRHRYTGVCPSMVHANGVANTRMWKFLWQQFSLTTGRFNPVCDHAQQQDWTGELTVLTWNTGDAPGAFELSCKALGIPSFVMKKDVKVTRPNTRITYPVKIELTLEMLERVKTPYVMMADSFDAMMLESPARILECYKRRHQGKVVFGAEVGHFPVDVPTADRELERAGNHIRSFLNSGFCVGKTDDVKAVYGLAKRRGDRWKHDCLLTDQAALKTVYASESGFIELDHDAAMCLNLYGTEPGELEILYHDNGIRLETV